MLCLSNLSNDTASWISIKPQMHAHCTFFFPTNLLNSGNNNLTCFNNISNGIFRSLCIFIFFINYSYCITVWCDVSAFSFKKFVTNKQNSTYIINSSKWKLFFLISKKDVYSKNYFMQRSTKHIEDPDGNSQSKLATLVHTLWSPNPFEFSAGDQDLHMKALHWLDYMSTSNK